MVNSFINVFQLMTFNNELKSVVQKTLQNNLTLEDFGYNTKVSRFMIWLLPCKSHFNESVL